LARSWSFASFAFAVSAALSTLWRAMTAEQKGSAARSFPATGPVGPDPAPREELRSRDDGRSGPTL